MGLEANCHVIDGRTPPVCDDRAPLNDLENVETASGLDGSES